MSKYEENGMEIDGLDEIEVENTAVDDLDTENIHLVFIGIDQSYSMNPYRGDMEKCLKEFKNGLINSKNENEILIARSNFSDDVKTGGYKKISEFDTGYSVFNMTALYAAIIDGTGKLLDYYKFLKDEGHHVKAVFSIFGDGEDTMNGDFGAAKKCIETLNKKEIITAFISSDGQATQVAKDLGFRNILDVASSASELRKAFNCLSKSVIESGKSVLSDDGDDFFQV